MMRELGVYSIPFIIAACGVILFFSRGELFEEFIKGARDGMKTCADILPCLVLLLCAVKMFSASGALDILCHSLSGVFSIFGIPEEMIPVILMRPVSGSAANAMIINLFKTHGADSFAGRAASILMGSTDTIIYTLAMYFSAAGIKKTRYSLFASFILFAFCTLISCYILKLFM